MRHFRVFSYPEETEAAPFLGCRSRAGMERLKETASTAAVGCTIGDGQEAKAEILAYLA
jgi:hypothetical protein